MFECRCGARESECTYPNCKSGEEDKVVKFKQYENHVIKNLDYTISQAILDFAKTNQITNADIAGVFEAIKFRMFDEGL